MKIRHLVTTFTLATTLFGSAAFGQSPSELRQLYNLCSRSPQNSRCVGLDIPIPLDRRTGDETSCVFALGDLTSVSDCKMTVTDDALVVYVEEGEPIPLLDNRLATREVKIPFSHIFSWNQMLWNVSTEYGSYHLSELEIGYVTDSTNVQENHSNWLQLLGHAPSLTSRLSALPDQANLLSERAMIASSSMPVTRTSPSDQVRQLLETNQCVRCDLRGANLVGADLDAANLEGANLEGANLTGAELEGAYLLGANLNQANLTEADLDGARLMYASLENAILERASLQGTDLQFATLQNANLREAELLAPTTMRNTNLRNADLSNARLEGANLTFAQLEGTNLEGANLSDIEFNFSLFGSHTYGSRSLYFRMGSLGGSSMNVQTSLSGANLRNANLSNANLEDAQVSNADLSGAKLTGANLEDTDLRGTNLCHTTLQDGSISTDGCP